MGKDETIEMIEDLQEYWPLDKPWIITQADGAILASVSAMTIGSTGIMLKGSGIDHEVTMNVERDLASFKKVYLEYQQQSFPFWTISILNNFEPFPFYTL